MHHSHNLQLTSRIPHLPVPTDLQKISENLSRVRERIESAAESAGRRAEEVGLVAVTKYVGPAEAAALLKAGCRQLGESRPQQLWEKADNPGLESVEWHLIGHLQRNKVHRTLPLVALIHSVDSLRLLRAIDHSASQYGITARVLLEVNCSGDPEKHGLTADAMRSLLPELPSFANVEVSGLMTMAAREGGTTVARKNFASLRELRDEVSGEVPPGTRLTELSMGMSHDFEAAILEGATWVRIGSLLFEGLSPRT